MLNVKLLLAGISCWLGLIINGFFTNLPVDLFKTSKSVQSTLIGKLNLFCSVMGLGSLILPLSVKEKSNESLSNYTSLLDEEY